MPDFRPAIDIVTDAARFVRRLPGYLRRPVTPEEARATVRRRRERRELDFLTLARAAIYEHPDSPYLSLLRTAGCEYGDLQKLVSGDGLDAALRVLHRAGVYLTVDEFKGRKPVRRGSVEFPVGPERLRNPLSAGHVPARSSGSRSQGTVVAFDLDFVRACAVNTLLSLEARGGLRWRKADWENPGAGGTFRLLKYASFGAPPERWFSQIAAPVGSRYHAIGLAVRVAGMAAGVSLPQPVHVPLEQPLAVAHWMAAVRRAGGTPHLFALASPAVRLALAAYEAGIDLAGAQMMIGGEPVTDARLAVIRRTGAVVVPRYGSIETGPIGYACLSPEASDDVHLQDDLHALIQPDTGEGTFHDRALFVTGLLREAPFVFVNVSMGDAAVLSARRCGCPMEAHGWLTHLHSVRSYEKLNIAGTTFLDTDVIRVLEEFLPRRFGGAPTDYQLIEEDRATGEQRLVLVVHPDVGPLDAETVLGAFVNAVGGGALGWTRAGILHLERRVPVTTSTGKIHHMHLQRRPDAAAAVSPGSR